MRYHDFSITERDGRLIINDAPPVGALSAFSLELLAQMYTNRNVGVDSEGRMLLADMAFKPIRFDGGAVTYTVNLIVCERVA